MTSTSYGVSVDATTTVTTTTEVVSTCGTIYGCDVEDSTQTETAIGTTSATAAATSLTGKEEWTVSDDSDEELLAAAAFAQSELDSIFGNATATPTATPSSQTETSTTSETEIISATAVLSNTENWVTSTEEIVSATAVLSNTENWITSTTEASSTEPASTSSEKEEPTKTITPLELSSKTCEDPADFSGHADIDADTQDGFAVKFCGNSDIQFGPDDDPLEQVYYNLSDISYSYSVSWVDGCETTEDKQWVIWPLGEDSYSCQDIFVKAYEDCKFSLPSGIPTFGLWILLTCYRHKWRHRRVL